MNTYIYRVLYTPNTDTVIIESDKGDVVVSEAHNWTDVLQSLTEMYGSELPDTDVATDDNQLS